MRKFTSIDQIQRAMNSGEIRTFEQQNEDQAADTREFGLENPSKIRVSTPREIEARRFYILHIITHENPRRLP